MQGDKLTWFHPGRRVNDMAIAEVEKQLGVSFPPEFREFLREYQAGTPEQTDFEIDDPRKKQVGIGIFLGVDPELETSYIPTITGYLRDRIPDRLIPIAGGPGGDYVMMDLRGPEPRILYWHHERSGDPDELTVIADSFGEFLDQLHEPSDDE